MKAIEVITRIDADGIITPFRMRMEEKEEVLVFELKLISREKVGKYFRFKCNTIINNTIKEVIIRFYHEELKWYLE